ncbi:MAG: hypothetical protein AAGG75_20775 [Bacteroidota bacterium]
MKNKQLFLIPLALIVLLLSSCGDDDCAAPTLSDNIVGEWSVQLGGDVEFKANGELVDLDGSLIEGEINGVPLAQKTYQVMGDTLLSLTASDGGVNALGVDFDVDDNQCNEITLSILGIPLKMTRK